MLEYIVLLFGPRGLAACVIIFALIKGLRGAMIVGTCFCKCLNITGSRVGWQNFALRIKQLSWKAMILSPWAAFVGRPRA